MNEKPIAAYFAPDFTVYILDNKNGFVRSYFYKDGKRGRITTNRINKDEHNREYFSKGKIRFHLDEFKSDIKT